MASAIFRVFVMAVLAIALAACLGSQPRCLAFEAELERQRLAANTVVCHAVSLPQKELWVSCHSSSRGSKRIAVLSGMPERLEQEDFLEGLLAAQAEPNLAEGTLGSCASVASTSSRFDC